VFLERPLAIGCCRNTNGVTVGQRIEIDGTTVVDGTVVFTTNRSLTGTTGEGYASSEVASESGTFGGQVAAELFEADTSLDRVYVDQNAVVVTKDGAWDSESVAAVSHVIEDFFLFYPQA
jgi:hypothetical protein